MIESVVVESLNQAFTVIRDAWLEEQWYYIPSQPRLYERKVGAVMEPEFQLVKYQFKDPKDPQKELEGAILQFAATMDLPPEAITDLQKQISAKRGTSGRIPPSRIRLSALPLKSAQVALYAPKDGVLIPSDSMGSGNAPVIASQKMVFSIALTQIGADIYDSLVKKGHGGVPVICTLKYGGLTPRAGFTVTYNWDMVYDHFSKEDVTELHVQYAGLFDYSDKQRKQELFDSLRKSKALTVEVIGGEGFKIEDLDKYLDPIIKRIQSEIVEDMKPAAAIDPAKAEKLKTDPKTDPMMGGYGRSMSMKKQTLRKHGTETVNFNVRMYQERTTVAGGFIGIGHYPEELQTKLVTIVPRGEWDKAFFVLPTIFDDRRFGNLQAVDMELGLLDGERQFDVSIYKWLPQQGWKDARGNPRTAALFPLLGLKARIGDAAYKNLRFSTKMKVTQGGEVVTVAQTTPVFDGERAIATLPEVLDVIGIDAQSLSWKQLDPTSSLVAVTVKLNSGRRQFSDTLKPRNVDGKLLPPEMLYWLGAKDNPQSPPAAVTAQVEFVTAQGKRVKWTHSGEDLRAAFVDPKNILLFDTDWQNQ